MKAFEAAQKLKRSLVIGFGILFIALYCYGAVEHAKRVNLDVSRVDQHAYLSYAQDLYETNYAYVGGRNRMPIYPFLQSFIYDPDLTENEYFTRGKYLNIALSVLMLPCLFGLLYYFFPFLQAVNFWLITTFTVFIFRAGYFQAELLFYFLNFAAFLLMCYLLRSRSWQVALLTGFVLGITHLTKASILPGLALFALFFIAETLYSCGRQFWEQRRPTKSESGQSIAVAQLKSRLLSLGLVIFIFLGTVYPYISTSQRLFGQYFYNVNSTFYMWYNTWEEAKQGTGAHNDDEGWPDLPPESIPGPQKYLQTHTASEIGERVWDGLDEVIVTARESYGYFKYVVFYLAAALTVSLLNFRESFKAIRRHLFLALFVLTYFIVYLLLYAWYTPIASGNRLTLAQFLPLMFSLNWIIAFHGCRHSTIQILGYRLKWFDAWNGLIFGLIVFELYPILTHRIITLFAGT